MTDTEAVSSRPERRDAAVNRQRILDTAIRLFELHGVEQVSMNQIATEAQLGPGTLYRRYRNKSELCLDLIKDHVDLLFEDMETYLEQCDAEPPWRRLKEILRLFIRFREKKAQLLKGVEDSASTPPRPRAHGPIYYELHKLFVKLYDEMARFEQAPPNSIFRADMLLAALNSDSYLFQREVRGHTPELILEQIYLTFVAVNEK